MNITDFYKINILPVIPGATSETDHILGQKVHLNNNLTTEINSSIFRLHGIKLRVNNKRSYRNCLNICELSDS